MSFTDDIKRAAPFSAYDGRKAAVVADHQVVTVAGLEDSDEALAFLQNHPNAAELKKLIRKTDLTIVPLLAAVYFLQFLDKTTLSYTAVMGIRTDTHLKGQDYSNLSMLFYIGFIAAELPTQFLAQHFSRLSRIVRGTQDAHLKKAQIFETFKDGRVICSYMSGFTSAW
ncbi:hypothetical protein BJ546DRAFT_1070114 [Cryomyces antarcticus]